MVPRACCARASCYCTARGPAEMLLLCPSAQRGYTQQSLSLVLFGCFLTRLSSRSLHLYHLTGPSKQKKRVTTTRLVLVLRFTSRKTSLNRQKRGYRLYFNDNELQGFPPAPSEALPGQDCSSQHAPQRTALGAPRPEPRAGRREP